MVVSDALRATGPNIAFSSAELVRYFADHRRRWDEFYTSERWVIERLADEPGGLGRVLDVGCAVGGLGHALVERFGIRSYVGVDIHSMAIEAARRDPPMCPSQCFHCDDIIDCSAVQPESFDSVFCLSVADWNVRTNDIIAACWSRVAPGGRMFISLRLTPDKGVRDIESSFQFVSTNPVDVVADGAVGERAAYVVFNAAEALTTLAELQPNPIRLLGYGYWGRPSPSARTSFDKVTFAVFAVIRGRSSAAAMAPMSELHLPWGLWTQMSEQSRARNR